MLKLMNSSLSVVGLLAVLCPGTSSIGNPPVTFSEHIAPLVFDKCASCHRPGQSGPFSLLTYEDVSKNANTISAVLASGYMPPWKPVDTGILFANHRRLSTDQLATFRQWVDEGCPMGDLNRMPTPPAFPDGWNLGKPDLVVKMSEPFTIPADGPDLYRSFVFPIGLPEDKWIKAIELRPKARGAVHHALFFANDTLPVRGLNDRDGMPGLRGMNFLRGTGTDFLERGPNQLVAGLGGYVPGANASLLPGKLARRLPKGSNIVMQTHFHPTGKEEVEQAELGIYFTDVIPDHLLVPIQLPPVFGAGAGIDVPAGNANYVVQDEYRLPIDVEGIEIGGHAHYICRKMLMTAHLPNGKDLTLLQIDDWDLDWQDQYTFQSPVPLPKDTLLKATIVYDNSAGNPENPFSPPQRIAWGRESTDEMGAITLLVTAVRESERPQLESEMRKRAGDSIRSRVRQQTKGLAAIAGGQVDGGGMIRIFDRNRDGKLTGDEIPERYRERLLEFADRNGDGELEASELERSRQGISRFLKREQ